jgi:hypothetical protein
MIFWIFLQDDVQVPLLVSGISAFVNLHDFQVFQVIPMVWAFSNSGETSNHFVTSKDLGGSKNVFFVAFSDHEITRENDSEPVVWGVVDLWTMDKQRIWIWVG